MQVAAVGRPGNRLILCFDQATVGKDHLGPGPYAVHGVVFRSVSLDARLPVLQGTRGS